MLLLLLDDVELIILEVVEENEEVTGEGIEVVLEIDVVEMDEELETSVELIEVVEVLRPSRDERTAAAATTMITMSMTTSTTLEIAYILRGN